MNILELPDDILVHLLSNYLSLNQLMRMSSVCQRFAWIIEHYNLWLKYLFKHALIDCNYPFGRLSQKLFF